MGIDLSKQNYRLLTQIFFTYALRLTMVAFNFPCLSFFHTTIGPSEILILLGILFLIFTSQSKGSHFAVDSIT